MAGGCLGCYLKVLLLCMPEVAHFCWLTCASRSGAVALFRCVLNVWGYAQNCDGVIVILVANTRGVLHLENLENGNRNFLVLGNVFVIRRCPRWINAVFVPLGVYRCGEGLRPESPSFVCVFVDPVYCCAHGVPLVLAKPWKVFTVRSLQPSLFDDIGQIWQRMRV